MWHREDLAWAGGVYEGGACHDALAERYGWYKPHQIWLRGEGGKRADLYGADLRLADLRGADLRLADLRGADLRGADLRGAALRWADLSGADLSGADLRGANLRWAKGFHLLTQTDHGYGVYASWQGGEWRIVAGCRDYSIAEARAHWGAPDYHTPSSGSRIVALMDWLEKLGPEVSASDAKPRAAEFFAGIGLVRRALEQERFRVVFANDIEPSKADLYTRNFGAKDFILGDIRSIAGADVPDIELATASFPCTDLSLAGNREGLSGGQSGMFWEFARVLDEMAGRRPPVVLLENVLGFASSNGGRDMASAIARLNDLGYCCDVFVVDAAWFLPQSRQRMFIVGSPAVGSGAGDWRESRLRPAWVRSFVAEHPGLAMRAMPLEEPPTSAKTLAGYVERLRPSDERWWDAQRSAAFLGSLSATQSDRIRKLRSGSRLSWATACRRTRSGAAVWEIRPDAISGCLRTPRGGSSKQVVVEAGRGSARMRWMTAREYARLQGAPRFDLGNATEHAAMFGFGDAVCVPVVAWIARVCLWPLLRAHREDFPCV